MQNGFFKKLSSTFLGDFQDCCATHDVCYGTYGKTKAQCDAAFLSCTTGKCDANYGRFNPQRQGCYEVKDGMQVCPCCPAVPGATCSRAMRSLCRRW
jgi:hypothetical protein